MPMRPSRRRVIAIAFLVSGLAIAPSIARPIKPPPARPQASAIVTLFNRVLALLGIKAGDQTGSATSSPAPAPVPPPAFVDGDGRAGLDPDG